MFFFSLHNTKEIDANIPINLLDYFEASFLPRPTRLDIIDRPSVKILNFTDEAIVKALQSAESIELETEDYRLRMGFKTIHINYLGINVKEIYIKDNGTEHLKTFFLDLVQKSDPLFAATRFEKIASDIIEKHFEDTVHEDILLLHWLNYFGKEEFAKRGGEAIFKNPYIKTEKMSEGVLIQVGESPYDAYTPEGEALLVKASLEMPPYKRR